LQHWISLTPLASHTVCPCGFRKPAGHHRRDDCLVYARHNTKNFVVGGIDANRRGQVCAVCVVRERQQQSCIVNTRRVARARGLELLWLEGKRIDIDANRWDVVVVPVWLHPVEVVAVANLEAVVVVELENIRDRWVLASHALDAGHRVTRLEHRAAPLVRTVKRLLTLPWVDDGVNAQDERVALDDPDELLAWVVKVQLQLVGRRRDRLIARELENIDEVLVRDLGELAALVRVEVDVIDIERGGGKTALTHTVADGMRARRVRVVPDVCLSERDRCVVSSLSFKTSKGRNVIQYVAGLG
jgi:hypothetical protein